MKTLVLKIINTPFPRRGSKYSVSVHPSCQPMFDTLLKLHDDEIIALYDSIVHSNRRELV